MEGPNFTEPKRTVTIRRLYIRSTEKEVSPSRKQMAFPAVPDEIDRLMQCEGSKQNLTAEEIKCHIRSSRLNRLWCLN